MKKKYLAIFAALTLGLAACSAKEIPMNSDSSGGSSSSSSMSSTSLLVSRRPCSPNDFTWEGKDIDVWQNSWNGDDATTTVILDRPDKGFSVVIPYNPAWGHTDCQLIPYDEDGTMFRFGHASIFEGGGATRFNGIELKPPRSAEEVREAITAEQQPDREQGILPPGFEPKIITINGNTAVQYFFGGFCDQTNYEIQGKKFNYVISSICNVDPEDIKATVESFTLYN